MQSKSRKIVFVFPGIGSQWLGMGRQLLTREAVFRQTLDQCERAMQPFVEWSLQEQLLADKTSPAYRLDDLSVLWPTLVSIEIALAALWRAWGIEPDAVIGHSIGEVAASSVAGVFRLEDTMRIICAQGRFTEQARGGAMAVVGLSPAEALEALAGYEAALVISNLNSPGSVVLSGDSIALHQVMQPLQARGIFCKQIPVNVAAHSPHMDPFKADLLAALAGLQPGPAAVPIYSTTLGTVSDGTNQDAGYWVQNFRQPVLFSAMIQQLLADGYRQFIEISPHPILLHAIRQGFQQAGLYGITLPSLRRDEPEQLTLLNSREELNTWSYSEAGDRLSPAGDSSVEPLPARLDPEPGTGLTVSTAAVVAHERPPQGDIRTALLAVEPGPRRRGLLEAHLREQLAQALQLPPSRISLNRQFKALGLESLSSVEFTKRLETSLGLSLPSTLVWNYPTIVELVPYLANKMGIALKGADEPKLMHTAPVPSEVDAETLITLLDDRETALVNISFDEVKTLLDEELALIDDLLKGA